MALEKKDLQAIDEIVEKQVRVYTLPVREEISSLSGEVSSLREQVQKLAVTLDNFLKRLTDFEDEFTIVKAEVRKLKKIVKEKLGVDV